MPDVVTHDQLRRKMDAPMDRAEAVQTRVAAPHIGEVCVQGVRSNPVNVADAWRHALRP